MKLSDFPSKFLKFNLPLHCWLFCVLGLTSCSENQRLTSELKELQTREIEGITEVTAVNAQLADTKRRMTEFSKRQLSPQDIAEAEAKAAKLKQRLEYLLSATKAANEQTERLSGEITQYRIKYIKSN